MMTGSDKARAAANLAPVTPPAFFVTTQEMLYCRNKAYSSFSLKGPRAVMTVAFWGRSVVFGGSTLRITK